MSGSRKILLVDGDAEEIRSMQGFLAGEGRRVYTSSDGREALEMFCKVRPDLVLLDAGVPGINGIDLCTRMKHQPDTRRIPVIMTSGRNGREDAVAAMDAGADDFFHKPVDGTELRIRVESLLRMKGYADDLERSCLEIARKNERLEELERSREELAHMIIHDMTNPLSAVILGIETVLYERERLSEKQERILEICLVNSREHMALIDNILDVYRMESGGVRPEKKRTSLAGLIESVVAMFRHRIESKGITLRRPDRAGLPYLWIDPGLMKRVLANLVSNAIRHTPHGGTIGIEVQRSEDRDGYILSVTDTGTGMAPAYFQKVFDKFQQVEMKKDGVIKGSIGLGLAFCKLVVEAHDGRIWVESEGVGKGCSFRFVIPGALVTHDTDA
ncbi:MAG: hybrid sensor histidine kinase/response regulator [Deltaproteobacteria bacterium]